MFARISFKITAGLYTDFLNFLLENDYPIFDIQSTDLGFNAVCYAEDYKKIAFAARRFQCIIRIVEKKGAYFRLRRLKHRSGLAVGAVLFLILSYLFSNIIWDIKIDTDNTHMQNEITAQLYRQGITAGSFYTKEKLRNAKDNILLMNNNISYLSLNFYKGFLECKVYPKNKKADYISDLSEADIFSSMSGIITDLRVYSGYSQVELGQSVSQGDILVSHTTTDIYGNSYESNTRAYIEALCDKTYSIYIPFNKKTQVLTGHQAENIYLEFSGNDICIHNSDISRWDESVENTDVEFFTFMGFHLPVTVRTVTYYRLADIILENDTLTARNIARMQLQHMIDKDSLLKKEINRSYDYVIDDKGLQLNCVVTGHYQIT